MQRALSPARVAIDRAKRRDDCPYFAPYWPKWIYFVDYSRRMFSRGSHACCEEFRISRFSRLFPSYLSPMNNGIRYDPKFSFSFSAHNCDIFCPSNNKQRKNFMTPSLTRLTCSTLSTAMPIHRQWWYFSSLPHTTPTHYSHEGCGCKNAISRGSTNLVVQECAERGS